MALTRAGETALLSGRRPMAVLRELLGLLVDLGARAWVDEVLEMVALVCEADGAAAAARLLGAAGARSDRRGRVLSSEVNGCYDRLAKTLGPDAFAEHEATGRTMSAGEALSFALSELDASRPPVPR
jgi:hypothetical protein